MMRQRFAEPKKSVRGDVHKAAARIYEFSLLKDPVPLRWVIGKELIAGTRARMESFAKDLTTLEYLSEDLNLPDEQ